MSLTAFFGASSRTRGTTPPVDVFTYYVDADSGDDSNPGTSAQPFASISATDSLVTPGDSVYVRAATAHYRETPKPAVSGTSGNEITYYLERGAIISGLEVIPNTDWSLESGQIYKKVIALPIAGYGGATTTNTALMANQIIRNGEMMFQASSRSIASPEDLFIMSKWKWKAGADFQPTYLIDSDLAGLGLGGGKVVTLGWFISGSDTITSQSVNQINWTNPVFGISNPASPDGIKCRKYYFVTGKLSLLTEEKEWHYDSDTTTLYFRQPGGGTPSGTIEYKARNWGFDLRGRDHIYIKGGTFIGCEPCTGDNDTNDCTVDNVRCSFQNHTITHETFFWQGYGNSRQTGVKMCGLRNVVKNSEFTYAGSQSVWIGSDGVVQNNKFQYIGYDGMWGCPIAFWGIGDPDVSFDDLDNILVEYNTARYVGRGCLDFGFSFVEGSVQNVRNHTIRNNDFRYYAMLNQDSGCLYSWGYMNLSGTRIYQNIIGNLAATKPPDASYADGIMAAVYFDMGSGGAVGEDPLSVYDNIFFDNGETEGFTDLEVADVYELTKLNYSTKQGTLWYNNILWTNKRAYYIGEGTNASVIRNNISRAKYNFFFYPTNSAVADMDYGIIQENQSGSTIPGGIPANVQVNTNPLFVGGDINDPLTFFKLQSGSPARGEAISLPGYNTSGDLGAIPYSGPFWTAGYTEETLTLEL